MSYDGGVQYENVAFGDDRSMAACRTGEFGWFAGWTMLKKLLLYGYSDERFKAASKYINNWALNKHNGELYTSALCREAHDGWRKGAIRETSGILGMKYPSLTYSTSGNYFLIKYAETFKNFISK